MKTLVGAVILGSLLCAPVLALADDDARDYIPAPPGTSLFITYFKHSFGHKLYGDGDVQSDDFNLVQNVAILRPVYFTKIGPFVADPQVLIPAGNAEVDTGGAHLSANGISDPILVSTIWLVNNPDTKTWFGVTPFLTVPIGAYDNKRPLNMGANRWAFKGEAGFVKGLGAKTYWDLIAAYEIYGNNNDYGADSTTKKQEGVATLETHLSYDLAKDIYAAVDYFYHVGGETEVDGEKQHDALNNHAAQVTVGMGIASSYQLLVQYRSDFAVKSGPKTDTFGVRLLHVF
ncbi:MAG: transporter [Deltaproteobacteria bacterium]|nr:transporter [Deltaproteobacteria bacterium]